MIVAVRTVDARDVSRVKALNRASKAAGCSWRFCSFETLFANVLVGQKGASSASLRETFGTAVARELYHRWFQMKGYTQNYGFFESGFLGASGTGLLTPL